nr:ribonuclease H-like domain-containing protein [Tanacetum cinerariifolium]
MVLVAMIGAFRLMKNQQIMPSWHLPPQAHHVLIISTNRVNAASTPVTAVGLNSTNSTNNFNAADMHALEGIIYLDDEEDVGAEADFSNLETSITFCGMKGIKREFNVARTPQQNGVVERKNKTLIEAARTMLADSLLPILFLVEAVTTACYVKNKVLVTKPHYKTPYEFLLGRTPSIRFMRPFGCLVTILNTLDPLGKFDRKADEGFLVGYSSMNYQTIVVGNLPNHNADAQNTDADAAFDDKENESEVYVSPSSNDKPKKHDEKAKKEAKGKSPVDLSTRVRDLSDE